jgi:predicted MFS family arabinose efflux permease
LGAAFGGYLLDHISVGATFVGGASLLLVSACVVGSGWRLRPGTPPGEIRLPGDED